MSEISFRNNSSPAHAVLKARLAEFESPMLTCEPVLAEACFVLQASHNGPKAVVDMLTRGVVKIGFRLTDHDQSISRLLAKYANVPMSLADVCLVRMSEICEASTIMTTDTDFRIYRRHGRKVIPVDLPPST